MFHPLRRASIRTRVALIATLLAFSCLGTIGYIHLNALSSTLSEASFDDGLTGAGQLARATEGAGEAVVQAIAFSERGLDGVVLYDRQGRALAAGGDLAPTLKALGPEARKAVRTGRPVQEFRIPARTGGGTEVGRLSPSTDRRVASITVIPTKGGALATANHEGRATERLRGTAIRIGVGLVGGAMFMCFGLLLLLSRLVTRPISRLASEVRHMGEGNKDALLSDQSSPELRGLAEDISTMRDELTQAEQQSSTDPLTGIANHRAFHERLGTAVSRSQQEASPVALIALDLDNFKQINDRYGHVAGDRVIAAVAQEIQAACREHDLCARVGGDEFAVICPGADRDSAGRIADRIADSVRNLSVGVLLGSEAADTGITVAVSVGVSDMPASARSKDDLILRADAAMYEAKGHGSRRAPRVSAEPKAAGAANDSDRLELTVRALAVAVDAKDSGTRSHSDTVGEYAVAIGRELGMERKQLDALRRAAVLHDVGKIGTPDAVLLKPSALTDDEWRVMTQHPVLGYRILRGGGLPEREALWVLHHHEHLDGSGYPHGLKGDEIPLESRVILVADAFEAMTSDRPYRSACPAAEALAELRRCAGRQFEPRAVEALARVLEASPVAVAETREAA